jgi:putative transposase
VQLTWQARLAQQPSLLDMGEWPVIDALSLPRVKRRQFLRNQRMIAQALAQIPLNVIAADFNVTPALVLHWLNRALGGDEEAPPALTRALVPSERLHPNRRRQQLGTLLKSQGHTCSFGHLLTVVPGLEDYLHQLLKKFCNRSRTGQNLKVSTFHKAFLRYLRQSHWPADTYPFTVTSQGYESVRRYFHRELDRLRLPREARRVIAPTDKPVGIFQEVQIDEHTVDCHGAVIVELHQQWEPLRVSRVTLIAAREVTSGAILGALLVLDSSPCADDLLTLLALFTRPWEPRPLSAPGLAYPPGDCMPTALGEAFLRPAYGIFRFDNALIHRALAVRDYICDRLGATFNLGLPRYPLARVLIETAFKDLNLTIHRFPSTTGSYPTDPLKEPLHHRKKPPAVSIKVLEEAIQVHMATLNVRPQGNLGGASPIDLLRDQMAHHWVPLRPDCALEHRDPMVGSREVPVHYTARHQRRPWVNFEYLRYDAPGVLSPELARQKIRIEFDRRDLRQLKAFTLRGEFLGILNAPATWQRFPHTLSTRKMIMKLVKQGLIQSDDPFAGYYDHLLHHRTLPAQALELVRVHREFGGHAQPQTLAQSPAVPTADELSLTPKTRGKKTTTPVPGCETVSKRPAPAIPDWSPNMVDKRRTR